MTSQEMQRTMEFILRSQADAVIRMDQWDERMERREEQMERRMERWEEQSDKQQQKLAEARADIRQAAKVIHETAKMARNHEKRIRSLDKSKSQSTKRFEGMRDVVRILVRLQAHQGRRLDRLEKK